MSFYTSLSGLRGAQTDLATTANNIANVGSVGFKKSYNFFLCKQFCPSHH